MSMGGEQQKSFAAFVLMCEAVLKNVHNMKMSIPKNIHTCKECATKWTNMQKIRKAFNF